MSGRALKTARNSSKPFSKTTLVRDYEAVLLTKSGEALTFLISGEEIEYDHAPRLMLVFNDITARVKAEKELQATLDQLERKVAARTDELSAQSKATKEARDELLDSELKLQETNRMLHLVLDAIPVRVFWKDKNLNYLGCNRLFAMDAGFSNPRQVIGKSDYKMPWSDQVELYRADDNKVISTGSAHLNDEEPQTKEDGEKL